MGPLLGIVGTYIPLEVRFITAGATRPRGGRADRWPVSLALREYSGFWVSPSLGSASELRVFVSPVSSVSPDHGGERDFVGGAQELSARSRASSRVSAS